MTDRWIKIYSSFKDWQWFQSPEMVQLFLCLLLDASPSRSQWRDVVLERGQLVTSYESLHIDTGLSIRTIRTCLSRLENAGEIVKKVTNKCSIITICNYDEYCDYCQESNDKQEAIGQQPAATPPAKPKRTKAEIEAATKKRMQEFYLSLVPYVNTYGKEMVRSFYDYWSETNKSGSKMKWEQETTWSLERRLLRWSHNDKSYKVNNNGTNNIRTATAEDRARQAADIVARLAAEDDNAV